MHSKDPKDSKGMSFSVSLKEERMYARIHFKLMKNLYLMSFEDSDTLSFASWSLPMCQRSGL